MLTGVANLAQFASALSSENPTQADAALALLWFHDHYDLGYSTTPESLNEMMAAVGLRPATRHRFLKRNLEAKKQLVIFLEGKIKLSLKGRAMLDQKYLGLLQKPNVVVVDTIIPKNLVDGLRKFYSDLTWQINGMFKYQFYDGCLVQSRRMIESLIVDLYEKINQADKIKTPTGDFMMLNGLIGVICSGQHIKLSKGAKEALEKIKEGGDKGAHNRFVIAIERDVQNVEVGARTLISELVQKLKA